VATAGAAAALAGLIFVAVSINLEQILKYPAPPGSASSPPAAAGCTGWSRGSCWVRGGVLNAWILLVEIHR
jgi:hypothetical protein